MTFICDIANSKVTRGSITLRSSEVRNMLISSVYQKHRSTVL